MKDNLVIRKGVVKDVPRIYELLNYFGDQGILLPRSLSELYDVIRDFYVAYDNQDEENLLSICSLHICWEKLGEIRSLAVNPDFQGADYGAPLVEACMQEAIDFGLTRLFTLTYIPDYFKRFGFELIEKSQLPHKIWADCVKCVKFPDCDEIAMARDI